ncbi:MAG TPA: pyridoxal-phosphate dependent enzyme [Thermoanaerobaculia bacterium]|nr:pyridoxal-phosphate dependent enzyme [Thermoanaerobaculia bacterium]
MLTAQAREPFTGPREDRRAGTGIHDGVLATIGGTPLVRLQRFLPSARFELLAKLEALNPGGSIKDRPALAILEDALHSGAIGPET